MDVSLNTLKTIPVYKVFKVIMTVSDIIKLWFYKLVEIKLKEKSYDIEMKYTSL